MIRQSRSTQRRTRRVRDDEARLVKRVEWLASEYGRYGYRRITALLPWVGWRVNHKRVERIWREEGLKVTQKQPRRRRLWLNDGSCIRLRPTHRNHVWSYDFVMDRTSDGRPIRMLTIVDEFTRALGYRPPAPEARQPSAAASATPQRPHWAGLSEGNSLA